MYIPLVVELPFEFLADVLAFIADRHGASGQFNSLPIPLVELLVVVVLPVVGLSVVERSVSRKFSNIIVDIHILVQTAVVEHFGEGSSFYLATFIVGDDVDDTGNSIAAIKRAGGTAEHLDAFYVVDADSIPTVVATDALSVLKNKDVAVADTVEIDKSSHSVGLGGDAGCKLSQSVLQTGGTNTLQFVGIKHADGDR